MSKQGAEAFGRYLAEFVARSGRFRDRTSLGRAAGVDPSSMSRYIRGEQRPDLKTLRKLAPIMGATTNELIAIAYPEDTGEVEPLLVEVDPLVSELAAMLAADSPLSVQERETVRTLVDRVIDPHRRQMRSRRRHRSA
jgi:transcriptional regulator with XRE-family HTH domain